MGARKFKILTKNVKGGLGGAEFSDMCKKTYKEAFN